MSKPSQTRRTFLRALGIGAAFLPLLESRGAGAQVLGPKRLIIMLSPNGVIDDLWWPSGSETSFTFPEMTQSLNLYKQDLIVLRGISLQSFLDDPPRGSTGGSHDNYPALLTGKRYLRFGKSDKMADGPSVDQYVADGLAKAGVNTPFRALTLGANANTGETDQAIFRGSNSPVTPENDPYKTFDTVFANQKLRGPQIDRIVATRTSVLDYVGKDLERFGARLGTDDRQRIEVHLQTIRDIEKQLGAKPQAGCVPPTAPSKIDPRDSSQYDVVIKTQIDMMIAAMTCDLTRVASLQMSDHSGDQQFLFLGGDFTKPSPSGDFGKIHNHHEMTHHQGDSSIKPLKIRAEQFYMEQVAYVIKRLKETSEGGGSMLDNTAVLYMNGAHSGAAHSSDNMPMILAGRCGGAFKTGRNLQFSKVPHNGVLIALANAMGVTTSSFGDSKYGGELMGLRG